MFIHKRITGADLLATKGIEEALRSSQVLEGHVESFDLTQIEGMTLTSSVTTTNGIETVAYKAKGKYRLLLPEVGGQKTVKFIVEGRVSRNLGLLDPKGWVWVQDSNVITS